MEFSFTWGDDRPDFGTTGMVHQLVFPCPGALTGPISIPDLRSAIVTERLQLTAEMIRADAKRPLDRARNGLGPRSQEARWYRSARTAAGRGTTQNDANTF